MSSAIRVGDIKMIRIEKFIRLGIDNTTTMHKRPRTSNRPKCASVQFQKNNAAQLRLSNTTKLVYLSSPSLGTPPLKSCLS